VRDRPPIRPQRVWLALVSLGGGYQAVRVDHFLDHLEKDQGLRLSDYPPLVLRRRAQNEIPAQDGLGTVSRQVVDRVIKRRLAK
jgi:hypothetical protein